MEKLRSQQEQTLGTLDRRIDAMMERRSQAIMDRLDGFLGNRGGLRNRGANSGEPKREPRVNFNEQPNRRRTYGSTRGRAFHPAMPQGIIGGGAQTPEEVLLATDRPRPNNRRQTQIRLGELIPQAGVMRIKEEVNPATRTGGKFRSLYRRETMLRRGIHVMQRQ